jgi:hypothetical protein
MELAARMSNRETIGQFLFCADSLFERDLNASLPSQRAGPGEAGSGI